MFLTDDELATLTGLRQAKRQLDWLAKTGWKVEPDRFGRPRVLRAYAEQRMGMSQPKKKGPRLEGLNGPTAYQVA